MHGNAYLTGHFLRTIIGINNSDNKKKSVSEDKISDLDDNILIVNEQLKVQIEGTVKYVSENCKISDGVVETAKTDDGISYIVYTLK